MILNIGIKVIIMKEMEVLNGSCMKNSDSELFDLYNSNVSLVILYDDNGSIDNENTHLIKLKDVRYFGKQIKVCLWIEYTPHMILI
jgi:hypothetical protein